MPTDRADWMTALDGVIGYSDQLKARTDEARSHSAAKVVAIRTRKAR